MQCVCCARARPRPSAQPNHHCTPSRWLRSASTQVPVNPVVRVKGRFSRHLRYRNAELVLER